MANYEIALPMEHLEEKATANLLVQAVNSEEGLVASLSSTPDSDSKTRVEKSSKNDEHRSSRSTRKWARREEILDGEGSVYPKWKKIFVIACVFAVVLDPLFLYIPIINQDRMCLGLDKNMKIAALILRLVTDIFYIMDIIIQIYRSGNCANIIGEFCHGGCFKLQFIRNSFLPTIAKSISQSYIIIDILAILPLPQVVILNFFTRMRGSTSLNTRKFLMNFFVLIQYVPRVLRIYQLCKEPKKPSNDEEIAIWVKGVLNLFMYILSSHVLGAVWYFFAIQRMTVCWQYACRNENECDHINTFGCHDHHTFRNITFLNDLCPINAPNTTLFDFGIFTSILQSGIPGSTNYFQKFSNCFCWGLRNLSSLASNLQPSINAWENLFVAFISIIGLLLFIYLIGNLQTYMQLDTARKEEYRHKMRIERRMEELGRQVELWLPKTGIPKRLIKEIKLQIMKTVRQELEENRDVDMENILSILPSELQNYINSCMPLNRLKQVSVLQNMDEQVLKTICEHLQPKNFYNNIIIREEEPLKMMLFIVEGVVKIEKGNASYEQRGAGEFYGDKLLGWPSWNCFPNVLPTATETARAFDDVEALLLTATDMENISSEFRSHFSKEVMIALPKSDWLTLLKKVPKLQTMDELVLEAICKHLKPTIYPANTYIIQEQEPLEMMVLITDGFVRIESTSSSTDADYYGELLNWVFDSLFPTVLPFSTSTAQATNDVEALVLTVGDLYSVFCEFEVHFSESQFTPPADLVRFHRLGLGNW